LASLCSLYDKWGQPEKSDACYRHELVILEREYGPDSQVLAPVLTKQAEALRTLGRTEEAAAVEQRLKSVQTKPAKPK
jgi:hypothetical protein